MASAQKSVAQKTISSPLELWGEAEKLQAQMLAKEGVAIKEALNLTGGNVVRAALLLDMAASRLSHLVCETGRHSALAKFCRAKRGRPQGGLKSVPSEAAPKEKTKVKAKKN